MITRDTTAAARSGTRAMTRIAKMTRRAVVPKERIRASLQVLPAP